jgi:cytochrome c-type biogenesis protein CcmH
VRERLKAGDSDAQVLDFLTARYGEFVLLKPRLAWHNALLWLAPPAVLAIGIMALVVVRRGRRAAARRAGAEEPPLTASEQARLAQLLEAEAKRPARNSPR